MSGYPYRLQTLWIACLALAWLGACSPWPAGWNGLLAVLVVGVALIAIVVTTRRLHTQRRETAHVLAAVDGTLHGLPDGLKRHTPLVVTVGEANALGGEWGEAVARVTEAAIWVRCDSPDTLMHLADALKRWRDGQGPDAVMMLVAADQDDVHAPLAVALKRWRSAIGAASRAVGYALPVGVAVYTEEPRETSDPCPWFGVSGTPPIDRRGLLATITARLERYARDAAWTQPEGRAHRAAVLDALVRWASSAVLPVLCDGQRGSAPLRVSAFGVTTGVGPASPSAPFAQFIGSMTGLARRQDAHARRARLPLPDALVRGFARQPGRRPLPRALVHAFLGLAVFFCAGAASSAWQNRALIQRVAGDMARYQSIDAQQDAARVDALGAVKQDRDELERYADAGVPPHLGFGLYRGGRWLPVVNRLIASYQPPAPPPAVVTLDSMSLFDSGKAQLKAGSTRALVGALEMIKAHPDKRVLVAGYTDSVGSPQSNLVLSEARAAAVRDWLIEASGLSPTRFAIQGYGDTRPRASNDTDIGRAANRRVDITLIPDCRDGRDGRLPQGPAACS